jgi:hypothetical protein
LLDTELESALEVSDPPLELLADLLEIEIELESEDLLDPEPESEPELDPESEWEESLEDFTPLPLLDDLLPFEEYLKRLVLPLPLPFSCLLSAPKG